MAHSAVEIYHLSLINEARNNPAGTAKRLGIDLNEGLPAGTISTKAKPPLKLNDNLRTIAISHSQDMIANDFFSHISPTYGSTQQRFDASTYDYNSFAENISLIPSSGVIDPFEATKMMFESLFIDNGVDGKGHRLSILNTLYREIGIGQSTGDYTGMANSVDITEAFGLDAFAVRSITGFVLQDVSNNGLYNPGEGINGITVDVQANGVTVATTTTNSSGYYSADVMTGPYVVIARTSGHEVSVSIEVTSENVQVNLFWSSTVLTPPHGMFESTDTQLQLSSDYAHINDLYPINMLTQGVDIYTLSWAVFDSNVVYLDNEVVPSVGFTSFRATNAITHVLRAVGPGGVKTWSIPITISAFPPFSRIGSSSGSVIGGSNKGGTKQLSDKEKKLRTSDDLHIRIAEVVRVSSLSRELDIRFIDGETTNRDIIRCEVWFSTFDADTTPTPSAAVVGKGDRVVVLVDLVSYYVVSKLDRFEYPNNNRAAVYPKEILTKILNTFCIGAYYTQDAYSFADFLNPTTEEVTRIYCDKPNKETNRIPYRLLRQLSFTHLQNCNTVHVNNINWPYEGAGGGAMTTQPISIAGTVRHKNTINGVPYVVDLPFGQANYDGDLSAYSPVLSNVDKALCHPLAGATKKNNYSGYTILWFDDEDPEWVLVIATYPSWSLAPYIKFIEVPVYGWSERARNDDEDVAIILTGTDRVCYLRHQDLVREIYSITRSWVDWGTADNSIDFSESMHRALAVPAVKIEVDHWKFVVHDGFGYSNGSVIFMSANQQKLFYGDVTREIAPEPAANGSPYKYNISHGDPNAGSSNVNLYYQLEYKYYKLGTTKWESQKATQTTKDRSWIIYTNGINSLFKKIDINYGCVGAYAGYPWQYGGIVDWTNETLTSINNSLREYIYWNSVANKVAEYRYDFTYASNVFRCVQSLPTIHYANVDMGLFILEIIEMDVTNTFGPNNTLTSGTKHRKFVVWYQGYSYTLMDVAIDVKTEETKMPQIYNFWPWQMDANAPQKPGTADYDFTTNYNTLFYLSSFCNYYNDPIAPYRYRAVSYPTMQGDVSSMLFVSAMSTIEEDFKADYIQVSIDPVTESWAVTIKNILPILATRSVTFPDGGGSTAIWPHGRNTLYKIGKNAPTFVKPPVKYEIAL